MNYTYENVVFKKELLFSSIHLKMSDLKQKITALFF